MVALHYPDGDYDGDCNGSSREGNGTFIYKSGRLKQYTGQWKDNRFHGMGELLYADGRKLHGLFAFNQYIGIVNKCDDNGEETPITSVEEYPEGLVSIIRPNGKGQFDTYKGEWFYGARHGYGECKYGSGRPSKKGFFYNDKYIAKEITLKETGKRVHLTNGSFSGRVKIVYANDEVYEGDWKDGFRHGYGDYYYSNHDVYHGYWEWGERCTDGHGQKSIYHSEGTGITYLGEFQHDVFHGKGKITKDGMNSNFQGEFRDGLKEGIGFTYFAGVGNSKGNWHSGRQDGTHIFSFDEIKGIPCKFKGSFENGRLTDGEFYNDTQSVKCKKISIKKGAYHIILDNPYPSDPQYGDFLLSIKNILKTKIIVNVDSESITNILEVAKKCGSLEAEKDWEKIIEACESQSHNTPTYYKKTKHGPEPKKDVTSHHSFVNISEPALSGSYHERYGRGTVGTGSVQDRIISMRGCATTSYLIWD